MFKKFFIFNLKRHCYCVFIFIFVFIFMFIKFINITIIVICESFKYNGLITSLSLYPIKYLNELYSPCFSFLETNILLTSISFILDIFLFLL